MRSAFQVVDLMQSVELLESSSMASWFVNVQSVRTNCAVCALPMMRRKSLGLVAIVMCSY